MSRSRDNLDQHVALADRGLAVVPVVADAATDVGIATVLDRARSADGRLYSLVNIAGGAAPDTWMPATRVTRQAWRDLFTQNLETMFFAMSQAVAEELRTQGLPGSIVSLSSISGMNTAPYHVASRHRQAAVVAATRTMAAELAAQGIRVNAVAPGVTETPASRAMSMRILSGISARHRDGPPRPGPPNRQAPSLFLLSDLCCRATSPGRPVGRRRSEPALDAPGSDNTRCSSATTASRTAITSWGGHMADLEPGTAGIEELSEPTTIGVDAYISPEYARAERDACGARSGSRSAGSRSRLRWAATHLRHPGRLGHHRTNWPERIHRPPQRLHAPRRRLIDVPDGAKNALGRARKSFVCGFHGWTYGLDGTCTTSGSRSTGRGR